MIEPYYSDELVRLYCCDVLEALHLLREADVMVTDPPYGIGWTKGQTTKRVKSGLAVPTSSPHEGIAGDLDCTARDAVLAEWGDERPAAVFGSLLKSPPLGVKHVLVWEKPRNAGLLGSTLGFRRDLEAIYLLGVWPRRRPAWGSVLRSAARSSGNPPTPRRAEPSTQWPSR